MPTVNALCFAPTALNISGAVGSYAFLVIHREQVRRAVNRALGQFC
jgi:hypothetical protein